MNVTLPTGWILVHDNRGGIHHYRRELADGTLLSVWQRPRGGWVWIHADGADGRKLAGTAYTRTQPVHSEAVYAIEAAEEYHRTQESTP